MNDIEFLIAKYDRNVPRYTSYPTANHFSGAVGAASYAARSAHVLARQMISPALP